MTLSYQWLMDYLPTSDISVDKMAQLLTAVGLEVEQVAPFEKYPGGLAGLVVGEVIACDRHPNAERLSLTKVHIGQDTPLSIVCGAPNVAVGQKVVVAPIGTTIYPTQGEPLLMKRAKIRGEESEGMICAEDEIGLSDSHEGIMLLPADAQPGTLLKEYLQVPATDSVFEIGLTPNRMDAMSHLGAAKDVLAAWAHETNTDCSLRIPPHPELVASHELSVQVSIADADLCARYAGVCLSHVQVAESPQWLQDRLIAIGLRPINNVVDITNYVLHECGQPLHAFDLQQIKDSHIIVRKARAGEKFVTLDQQELALDPQDLVIADTHDALCLAGVYGGAHSGVTASTTTLFLESAWFHPRAIRRTSLRHQLRTDAAQRFEKGADISMVPYALQRAVDLLIQYAGAQVASAKVDVYPSPFEPKRMDIAYDKINALSGKQYDPAQVRRILQMLGFGVEAIDAATMRLQVPLCKPDISSLADIVEEVMRIDGIDQIPFTGKISYSLPEQSAYKPNQKQQVASQLVAKGFYELFSNSITNKSYYEGREDLVVMMNSLSAKLDTMRPSLLETGLESVAHNLNRKNTEIKFFELGNTYTLYEEGDSVRFEEKTFLALFAVGHYRAAHWSEKQKPVDGFYLKGIIEAVLPGIKWVWQLSDSGDMELLFQNKKIGRVYQVPEAHLKMLDIKQATVWYAELEWSPVEQYLNNKKYQLSELPKYPAVQRDLSMIVPKEVRYSQLEVAVKQAKCKSLQQMNLFDVFESEKLGADKKSLAVNFTFANPQKTMTDSEIEAEMNLIVRSLEQKLQAVIRSN